MYNHESPAAGRVVMCRKHSPWTMERDRKKSKAHLGSPECHETLSEEPEEAEDVLEDHDMTEQEAQVLACLGQLSVATLLGNQPGDVDGPPISRAGSMPDGQRRKVRGSRALSASYHSRLQSCLLNDSGSPPSYVNRRCTTTATTEAAAEEPERENQENVPSMAFVTQGGHAKCWIGAQRHPTCPLTNSSGKPGTSSITGLTTTGAVGGKANPSATQVPHLSVCLEDCPALTSLKNAAAAAATVASECALMSSQGPCGVSPAPKAHRTHRRSLSGAAGGCPTAANGVEGPHRLSDSAEVLHGREAQAEGPNNLPGDAALVSKEFRRASRGSSRDGATDGGQCEGGPAQSAAVTGSSMARYGIAAFGVPASLHSCFADVQPPNSEHEQPSASQPSQPLQTQLVQCSSKAAPEELKLGSASGRLFLAESAARVHLFGIAVPPAPTGALAIGDGSQCTRPLSLQAADTGGAAGPAGGGQGAVAPFGAPGRYAYHAPSAFSLVGAKALADSVEELELRRLTSGGPLGQQSPRTGNQEASQPLAPDARPVSDSRGMVGAEPRGTGPLLEGSSTSHSSACASGLVSTLQSSRSSASASGTDMSSWWPASSLSLPFLGSMAGTPQGSLEGLSTSASLPFPGHAALAPASQHSAPLAPFDLAGLARSSGVVLFGGPGAVGQGSFIPASGFSVSAAEPPLQLRPAGPFGAAGASAYAPLLPSHSQPAPGLVSHGMRPSGFILRRIDEPQQQQQQLQAGVCRPPFGTSPVSGVTGIGHLGGDASGTEKARQGLGEQPRGAAENRSVLGFAGDLCSGDQDAGRRRLAEDMDLTKIHNSGDQADPDADGDDGTPWLRTSQQAPDPDDPASAGKYSAVLLRRLQAAAEEEELYGACGADHSGVYGLYNLQTGSGGGLSLGRRRSYCGKPYGSNSSSMEPSPMPRLSSRIRRLRASPGGGNSICSRSSGGGSLSSPAPSQLRLSSRSAGVTPGTERRRRPRSELIPDLLAEGGYGDIGSPSGTRNPGGLDDDEELVRELGAGGSAGGYQYDIEYDTDQCMHDDDAYKQQGHSLHYHDQRRRGCFNHDVGSVDGGQQHHQQHETTGPATQQAAAPGQPGGSRDRFGSLSVQLPGHRVGGVRASGPGRAVGHGRAAAARGCNQQEGFLNGLMDYEDEGVEYSTPPHTPLRGIGCPHEHDHDLATGLRGAGRTGMMPSLLHTSTPSTLGGHRGGRYEARMRDDETAAQAAARPGLAAGGLASGRRLFAQPGRGGQEAGFRMVGAPHARVKFVSQGSEEEEDEQGGLGCDTLRLPSVMDGLESAQGFNRCIIQAASNHDRGTAERLWHEMCSRGVAPDVNTLNALLRCLARSTASPDDAHRLVREVCDRGGFSANGTSQRLLEEICFRFEQINAA